MLSVNVEVYEKILNDIKKMCFTHGFDFIDIPVILWILKQYD